jgi:hypothetical protein
MAHPILTPSAAIQSEMGQLCAWRVEMESKQQILLGKNIQLSRFLKLTDLDKRSSNPEMEDIRKHLDSFLRNWRFHRYKGGFTMLAGFYYPEFFSEN